jgi:hypothetical protein
MFSILLYDPFCYSSINILLNSQLYNNIVKLYTGYNVCMTLKAYILRYQGVESTLLNIHLNNIQNGHSVQLSRGVNEFIERRP